MQSQTPYSPALENAACDVAVVGAGAAGMSAAIAAARHGANVRLIEAAPHPGGTVTGALIHTLGGIYDERQQPINDGLVAELVDRLHRASPLTRRRKIGKTWCLSVDPQVYRAVVSGWIAEEPLIRPLYGTRVTRVVCRDASAAELEHAGLEGTQHIAVDALVDATGTAQIVRMIDERFVYDDEDRAAGGWIFRLRGVRPGAMAFPRRVVLLQKLQAAAREGQLPPICTRTWLDQGVHDDEVYVKLFVPLEQNWETPRRRAEILTEASQVQSRVIDYLRQHPDFAEARCVETGDLGVRDGGRIRGEYYLTADDVRAGRKFDDPACRCCWPIEYWHPRTGLELEYLPPGTTYEIPLRALKVAGLENVWAAGKCLSADHRAQASARVVGQCWAMGQSVGQAAAARGTEIVSKR